MKSPFNFSAALAACLAAAAAIVAPAVSNAGSVVLNGTQVCTDSPQLQMDSSGNLSVTCTAVGGGTTTFSCTLSPVVQSVTLGAAGPATITANCVNGTAPYVYSWSTTSAQPIDATTATARTVSIPGPFNVAGSYVYALTATDSAGTPATFNTSGTINVQAAGTCATSATNGAFTGINSQIYPDQVMPPPPGYTAYSFPIFATAGKMLTIATVASSSAGSQTSIHIQASISKCPGDFNPAQAACVKQANSATFRWYPYATAAEGSMGSATCTLAVGQQYYLNIRAVQTDLVTYSCTNQSQCKIVVSYQIQK